MDNSPFEPQVRDGAIYARGANDDKGQGFMHVKAFEYLVKTNQLKCNVKFIIDGEEEIGSPSFPSGHWNTRSFLPVTIFLYPTPQ